jgi:hypothetical protein
MADRSSSLPKPLLARKGEARPAEPGSRDHADQPIESDLGGYIFLRAKEPLLDIGPGSSEVDGDLAKAAVPQGDALGSESPEVGALGSGVPLSSALPSDSEDLTDKAAAGSLLDFRLIRARDRQVCPGASNKMGTDGPRTNLDIANLGAAMDVPRRAVSRPLTAAVPPSQPPSQPLPQPLPLARQGDAEGVQAQRGRSLAVEPAQQVIPPISDRPQHVRAAQEEGAHQEPQAPKISSRLPKIDGAAVGGLLAKVGQFTWARLRSFASVIAGTPHLAYLAGLLMLCALGGVWVILAEEMPKSQEAPQVAGLSTSEPSSSPRPDQSTEVPTVVPEAAEDGLDFGTFKAAPVLSGEQADALAEVPLETQAGPVAPPSEAVLLNDAADSLPVAGATKQPGSEPMVPQAAAEAAPEEGAEASSDAGLDEAAPTAALQQPPQEAPTLAAQEGAYTVQFYAARNRESAERELSRLQKDLSSILSARKLHISEIKQSNSRTMYRVRSDAFVEASVAQDFCGRLKVAGQDCLVLRHQ